MSRLTWNEIRVNASKFAEAWKEAHYEKGEAQSFYNDFFAAFGVSRRKVASFEEPVKKLNNKQGFIDLFWRKTLLAEHKSAGKSLEEAKGQALEYFVGIKDEELPRYLLVCDFQNFHLFDLDEQIDVRFQLAALPDHIEAFGFILGIQKRTFRDQAPANIAASEKMGNIHDALLASGYRGHDLERLLVRLLFCLFADDTGIFEPKDLFTDLIRDCTKEDGTDLGLCLTQLFETLNEREVLRQTNLDERLKSFPYVNGELFAERLRVPVFSRQMRERLLDACDFNWDAISPAIFGALFQSVMQPKERREKGAHYTTERNILKVIEPLFLAELRAEFMRLVARKDTGRRNALATFHERLASLRFFDPACGCGNFLVIAYRELRELELALLKELYPEGQLVTDIEQLCRLNVSQFYGIEKDEFPVRITEVALWMTDHIANNRLSLAFGEVYLRIPIQSTPHIHNADALEIEWDSVIPAEQCNYVFGNPPFIGAKYQTAAQRDQVRKVARLPGAGGTLDYVTAWFIKAGEYAQRGRAKIGFVSTNSLTQGEQVAQLWPILFDRYELEIGFAHRTFAWGSDARGMAHVHVVILGLVRRKDVPKNRRLFSYTDIKGDPTESVHAVLSPYLADASQLTNPHMTIAEIGRPINGMPAIRIGSKPIDGGNLIFDETERAAFLKEEPNAAQFLRPFVGAEEIINGGERWILALQGASPAELRTLPLTCKRLESVRQYREKSRSAPTKALAATPTLYHVNVIPSRGFLAVPKVSSEKREYIPIAFLNPPTVPSDLVFVILDAGKWHFALIASRMHMAWMRGIGGRLESRYRYSIGIVYNNFPLPTLDAKNRAALEKCADAVLDARAAHPDSTLADLYDPLTMPVALRKAHSALDVTVDKLYRSSPFSGDRERVEHLLAAYEALTAPLFAAARTGRRR